MSSDERRFVARGSFSARLRLGCTTIAGALALIASSAQAASGSETTPDVLLGRPGFLLVVFALVTLAPFAFMTLTAFIKISTVLHIAKSAIGAPGVPSNAVVMALATSLTVVAMAPVGAKMLARVEPVISGFDKRDTVAAVVAVMEGLREPLRDFLRVNASSKEKARFLDVARGARAPSDRHLVGDTDLVVLVPAFIVSELQGAFALGFAVYLPFMVLDLVVANILIALGMQMLAPSQVSLPLKLLLFFAVDGWGLLSRALVGGYGVG